MKEKVLVVDDEKNILDVLTYTLQREGFIVERASNGQEALEKVESFNPNIIVLDLMLPQINGYDVCRKIQEKNIGILMLTAKSDIIDKVLGLELGADDYLTKPYDIREVIARVKSLCRRYNRTTNALDNKIITIGNLSINLVQRTVKIDNVNIDFTSIEFDLLYLLLSNLNKVYSRDQLLNIIWKTDYFGGTRTVDTHIQRIRKKLGEKYQYVIQTVHGTGYRGVSIIDETKN